MKNCIAKETYEHIKNHLDELEVDVLKGEVTNKECKTDRDGYLYVSLGGKTVRVHHIIGSLIFGERMVGYQINHINGIKHDNRPVNLEVVTPMENVKHAFETGLKKALRGEEIRTSKLKEEDIIRIRELRKEGKTLKEIGNMYGISFQQVSRIVRGEHWKHLNGLSETSVQCDSFDSYQEASKRTANTELGDLMEILNYALGLVCEAAEVGDEIKKQIFHGHTPDPEKIMNELGDVLWYMSNLANKYGIRLSDVARFNIEKLQKRYPNGFTQEDSIKRVDCD